jgi:IS30 family transposase
LPDVQASQPRRTIANSQPLENQTSHHRDRPISERPSHIEDRKQVGHWEVDTVIGAAHKQAIATLVERKSGFALFAKVPTKSAD